VDSYPRLRGTLAHELCHVAQWVVDRQARPAHGTAFRSWAARVEAAAPGLRVDTCHTYEVRCKWRYRCTNLGCGKEYGRHTNSIDVEKQVLPPPPSPLSLLGTHLLLSSFLPMATIITCSTQTGPFPPSSVTPRRLYHTAGMRGVPVAA
jgi:hypothetical protein